MKHIITTVLFTIIATFSIYAYDDYYIVRKAPYKPHNTYYVDDKINEHKNSDDYSYIGIITRCGYTFADNGYFNYGASLYYNFNPYFGITAGFDGYYGNIYYYNSNNDIILYDGVNKNFPMWDVRFGFILGKYVSLGGTFGQCNICNPNIIVHQKYINNGTIYNNYKHNNFYGGFITFLCPVSKYFGLDIDLQYTNHTGFSLSGGLIIRFPVK